MSRVPLLIETLEVEERARGRWARIAFRTPVPCDTTVAYATLYDREGALIGDALYLRCTAAPWSRARLHQLIFFIPDDAVELRLSARGPKAEAMRGVRPAFHPLARAWASAHLLLDSPGRTLWQLARSTLRRPAAGPAHVRQLLATLAYEAQTAPKDYATWLALFDHWSEDDVPPASAGSSIAYLVLAREPASEALAATLQSVQAQWGAPAHTVLEAEAGRTPHQAAEGLEADYIGILQAGEVLPPHATRLAAWQLGEMGFPDIAIADEDAVSADGVRHSPSFKPEPNRTMMLSGVLSRGLWLVKRSVLVRGAPPAAEWAEVLRLAIWFTGQRAGVRSSGRRIPFILTHRRADTETPPPAALSAFMETQLRGGAPAMEPIPTWPLTFRRRDDEAGERITIIVPSTLRQPHSLPCIQAILEGTDYPLFDLHVVVMQPRPLDAQQQAGARALEASGAASVTLLEAPRFNFSEANNRIAARTSGEFILLLNDDVTPIRRDWLRWLATFLRDPGTGVVGARLLYPDQRVQHGGVIMGLSGLCDHAHRYLPAAEPGYMFRATIAQELSAVTAACMLVRRSLYVQVGGLDEGYPSAFNDVDFALRVGQAGYAIVYAPQAELHHHELQTYGSHYAGERQPYEAEEVQRMREDWAEVCARDPFHNPNLSLVQGFEWSPAFPPRVHMAWNHRRVDAPFPAGPLPIGRDGP